MNTSEDNIVNKLHLNTSEDNTTIGLWSVPERPLLSAGF